LSKNKNMDEEINKDEEETESELAELMLAHDLDEDQAEKFQELLDEGLDEDEAREIVDEI